MRNALGKALALHFLESPFHKLFCGDIGFRIFDELRDNLPSQFENFGISEQHMVSFAAAYASEVGRTSVVYTINPFITSRVHDQLRVDVAYSNSPLVICSVGAGFAYDNLGFTHFGLEDLGLISVLPNFKIFTPCDPQDVLFVLSQIFSTPCIEKPIYLRLQKGGEPNLDDEFGSSKTSNGKRVWDGSDFTILVHGHLCYEALRARKELSGTYSVKVISVFDWESFMDGLRLDYHHFDLIIEENHFIGSLASLIYREFSKFSGGAKMPVCLNVTEALHDGMATRTQLLKKNGLSYESLIEKITSELTC